jgi:phosphorylcholine metabolism protein LicD
VLNIAMARMFGSAGIKESKTLQTLLKHAIVQQLRRIEDIELRGMELTDEYLTWTYGDYMDNV